MDKVLLGFLQGLSGMFVLGIVGCLIVIPVTAFRLFGILFQKDRIEDE